MSFDSGRSGPILREPLPPGMLQTEEAMIDRAGEPKLRGAGLVAAGAPHARGQIWSVFRVAAGNCLEMYDFQIFGYYAIPIAATFFPSRNEYVSLLASLTTF